MIWLCIPAAIGVFAIISRSRQEWKRCAPGGPTIFRPVVNQRSIHG